MARTKKAPAQHKAEDDYILTTKLRCGKCQCFMVGESGTSQAGKEVHHYYKCVSVKHHRNCDKKTVRKDWIENLVINQVQAFITDDELIEKLADVLVEELGKESTALPVLKKELATVEKAIGNMLNAIQNGIFTASTKQRLEELEEQKNNIEAKIIQEEMTKPVVGKEIFTTWLKHFRKYDITNKDERQKLVDQFVNVIYLYDDHFDLYLNFRDGVLTLNFDAAMLADSKSRKNTKSEISSDLTSDGAPNINASIDTMLAFFIATSINM